MSQPQWKFLVNLGDLNPLEHDGYFIYVDETGVYQPEAEYVAVEEDPDYPNRERLVAYRFILEPCTYINGILSDNKFHPDKPAWFAKPESERASRPQDTTYLKNLSLCQDIGEEELISLFCSDDPRQRALAWRAVGDHYGYENLDSYPLYLRKREARQRYLKKNGVKY